MYINIHIIVYTVLLDAVLLSNDRIELRQSFPTFFHLLTPWQLISINRTPLISKMFVIDIVAVISNIYVVTVNK